MAILTGHDLTERLRYEMGFTKAEAEDSLQFLLNEITEALVRGDDVWIKNYLRMRLVDRPARSYMNNMTGEMSTLAPGKRIRIHYSPALLEQLDPGYGYRLDDEGNVYSIRPEKPAEEDDEAAALEEENLDEIDEEIGDEIDTEDFEEEDETEDVEAEVRAALMDFAKMTGKQMTGKG